MGSCGACDGCCPPDGGACVSINFTSVAQCGRSAQTCFSCNPGDTCQQGTCQN
jgi:hypothetical protein